MLLVSGESFRPCVSGVTQLLRASDRGFYVSTIHFLVMVSVVPNKAHNALDHLGVSVRIGPAEMECHYGEITHTVVLPNLRCNRHASRGLFVEFGFSDAQLCPFEWTAAIGAH